MKTFPTALAMLMSTCLVLTGCAKLDLRASVDAFPDFTAWTTYGTGTATYADLAAVANTISDETGSQIRILTSDTAVGRLSPLRNEQALMSRTGDEYIFSFHGDEEFAHADWGPQDLRMVWTPTGPHSMLARTSAGISTPMDLRGKKVPRATANPSVNNKIEAFLAYGGLTWEDVTPVDISYSEQPTALQNGKIDVLYQQVYGSSLFELASAVDVRWIELDPGDTERVEAAAAVAPTISVETFSGGAGQAPGEEAYGFYYPVPIVSYADVSDSLAYHTAKTIQESFPKFKDATATTGLWDIDHVVTEPVTVPFHPGTVKYLQEMGVWTPEAQQRNDELIAYGEELRRQWPVFLKQADTQADLRTQWKSWKDAHVEPVL